MSFIRKEEIDKCINEIREYYQDSSSEYLSNGNLINRLNQEERKHVNLNLKLEELVGCKKNIIINTLIKDKSKDKFTFYLLNSDNIKYEINAYDKINSTAFIELAKRLFYDKVWGSYLIMQLFLKGYKIKEEDNQFVHNLYKEVKEIKDFDIWTMLRYAVILDDVCNFHKALIKTREINTILSFKKKKPIGFNFPNLLGVAINAIQNYRENGDLILKAIEIFEVKDIINQLDRKKNTFKKKRSEYLKNRHLQDKEFEKIAIQLFPELK